VLHGHEFESGDETTFEDLRRGYAVRYEITFALDDWPKEHLLLDSVKHG
jgi:hypothetical protein